MEILGWWQDERKKMTLISNHYINKLLKRITRLKKLTLKEVQYMYLREIKELLLKDKFVSKKIFHRRRPG